MGYSNDCEANCFDIKWVSEGMCAPCAEKEIGDECFGKGDVSGKCEATAGGDDLACMASKDNGGKCQDAQGGFVCGVDDVVYQNECVAKCANVEVKAQGFCTTTPPPTSTPTAQGGSTPAPTMVPGGSAAPSSSPTAS